MAGVTPLQVVQRLFCLLAMAGALACIITAPFMPLFTFKGDIDTSLTRAAPAGSARREPAAPPSAQAVTVAATETRGGWPMNLIIIEQLMWTARLFTSIPGIPARMKTYEMYQDLPQLVTDFRTLQYLDVATVLFIGAFVVLRLFWIGVMLLVAVGKKCHRAAEATPGSDAEHLCTDAASRRPRLRPVQLHVDEGAAVGGRSGSTDDSDAAYAKIERNCFQVPSAVFLFCSVLSAALCARMMSKIYTTSYTLRGHARSGGADDDCNPVHGCIRSFASMGFRTESGWTLVMAAAGCAFTAAVLEVLPPMLGLLGQRIRQGCADCCIGREGEVGGFMPVPDADEVVVSGG